jgi:TolB-like protein
MEAIMKTKYVLAFVFVFMAAPAPADDLPAGKVKLIGEYEKQREQEADRKKTYFVLERGEVMRLRACGPTSFVILARGKKRARVDFDLKLDADKAGKVGLVVLRRPSRGFFVDVPEGTHLIQISASRSVLIRPKKVKRKPRKDEKVIAWQEVSAPQAAPETEPAPALASLDPEPLAPEPIAPPPQPEKSKEPAPQQAAPQTEPAEVAEAAPPPPPSPLAQEPEEEAPPVKAEEVKQALSRQFGRKVDPSGRPVEVRLRILADRLAAGMASLPGKGRYERFVVARFAENGVEVRDMELGTLVSAQLSTFLKRDHGFFLLERERLADILKEIEMSMTGLTDPQNVAKLGKMAGAQAIVVGGISVVGADFVVNARVISAEQATVLAAESMNVPRAGMVALSEESVVLRTKSDAVFRSTLIPGWGQFYNRQSLKGGIIVGAEAALIGAAVAMHFLGRSDQDKYTDSNFVLKYPGLTAAELGVQAQELRESAEGFYELRNIFIYSAIGVWLYNILDAYLFGIDGEKEAGLEITPTTVPDVQGGAAAGLSVGITY